MWEKTIRIGLAGMIFLLQACGGRMGSPVARYLPGDESRDCTSLRTEIASNESEIIRLAKESEGTVIKNVLLGATGVLLIVPWFFMDFKGGEESELEAMQRRDESLRTLAAAKGCSLPPSKVKMATKEEAEQKKGEIEKAEE